MTTITIPQKLIRERELVVIPRKQYEEFLSLKNVVKNRASEERDTDRAIKIYKKEKNSGKLKIIGSLADLK